MSPIFRLSSGGIDTAICPYDVEGPRSVLNISPGSLMARCRVVATRTGTREPPTDSAVGISTPCNGRPAQEQDIRATAKAPVARSRLDEFAALPTMMRALVRPVWKTERSQNNNNAP